MNMLLHSCQSHIFQIQIKLTETRMSDEKGLYSTTILTSCLFYLYVYVVPILYVYLLLYIDRICIKKNFSVPHYKFF